MSRALDADGDGFLGEADLQHWYRVNLTLLETNGYEAVSLEQLRQQLTDALHNAQLPPAFAEHVSPAPHFSVCDTEPYVCPMSHSG